MRNAELNGIRLKFKRAWQQVDSLKSDIEQPFVTRKDGTAEGTTHNPLWHLQELSDIDKHRTIHLIIVPPLAY